MPEITISGEPSPERRVKALSKLMRRSQTPKSESTSFEFEECSIAQEPVVMQAKPLQF